MLCVKKPQQKRRPRAIQTATGVDEIESISEVRVASSDKVISVPRPGSFLDALFSLGPAERHFFTRSQTRARSASRSLTLAISPLLTPLSEGSPNPPSSVSASPWSRSSSLPPSPSPLPARLGKHGKRSHRYGDATIPSKRKFCGPWSPVPLHADLVRPHELEDEDSNGESSDDSLSLEGQLRISPMISERSLSSRQRTDMTNQAVQAPIPPHPSDIGGTNQDDASVGSQSLSQLGESSEESDSSEDLFASQPSDILQTPCASQEDLKISSERRYHSRSVSSLSEYLCASSKSGMTWS